MYVRKLLVLSLTAVLALPAFAQFRKPEDAVKYRQSVMYTMGTHFYSRVGGMANGRVPFDAKAAAENVEIVATLSRLPWAAFPADSNGVGKTDAKPAVWTEQAKFKDLADKMQAEVVKLQAAAKTGDFEALKVAYRATSSSCKACHDAFTNQ
ncbi:cytochrome c [Caenimonas koreensis DSM 17982]|uniref:Cytochrome c n=1 Tax=Caenimonas koreensis DSM 17982 TaxID=1121255 RepID=A0A844AWY4_9BURK|nr:cytochrome c [Caenimonas koreensis]MRD49040.1 cytochrome c [Caenimonas koreensis DSM 17982]